MKNNLLDLDQVLLTFATKYAGKTTPVQRIYEPRTVLEGKTVLVTGPGSIGRILCKDILECNPKKLIIVDIAARTLVESTAMLTNLKKEGTTIVCADGDVADLAMINEIFATHQPNFVFHCAGMKYVPQAEQHPRGAFLANVVTTMRLLDICIDHDVEKFVFVSTDKSVKPTNVMGATKAIAERYILNLFQFLSKQKHNKVPKISAVRFGNVLGSDGSLIPLWSKTIRTNGTIPVTSERMERFVMTIPEATSLILQSFCMSEGGEVFVLDMGSPIKIIDLATHLKSALWEKYQLETRIVLTGIRPGEKMYEELWNDMETIVTTSHPKINKTFSKKIDFLEMKRQIGALSASYGLDDMEFVRRIKQIIPDFKSPLDSPYSIFD